MRTTILALALVAAAAAPADAFGIRLRRPERVESPVIVIVVPRAKHHRRERFEPIRPSYGPSPLRRGGLYQRRPVYPAPRVRR